MKRKKIAVIGSGFAGLSAAAYLSREGHEVHVYEKNEQTGGRARQVKTKEGYVFDMGPSWYWMPDVFEKFFADFGHAPADFYDLVQLDPSFTISFGKDRFMDIPADFGGLRALFERFEPGSAARLDQFMTEAAFKYRVGMEKLVYNPGLKISELIDIELIKGVFRLQVFSSFSNHVRHYFQSPQLIALMEFPVLFLGAMPQDTPALYSLMNYAGLKLGTWYPQGGFGKIIDGMTSICQNQGVEFFTGEGVQSIDVNNSVASQIVTARRSQKYDGIIAAADYNHVEQQLLKPQYRNYSSSYWDKRVMAPSSLIFYLGVTKKLAKLQHHTLFFDEDLNQHAREIYKDPQWPQKPLFYVCCPSKTDDSVAPPGHENLFLLMPLAPGLEDTEVQREAYFSVLMERLEQYCGEAIRPFIDYKRSYCINDFVTDYNAFKGNAYGLANTLLQTAHLKPKLVNQHVKNLFYAGQLTVPGPGVPPSIISGNIAAQQLLNYLQYESII